MRTLIVSDIHSNLAALESVVADAGGVDATWCLGDIVGYGPQPMECLELLWKLEAHCIIGNHDAGATGILALDAFNGAAAEACQWNGAQLTGEANTFLRELSATRTEPPFTLVHGAPEEPLWEYLVRYDQAKRAWEEVGTQGLLVGHSHYQFAFVEGKGLERPPGVDMIPLDRGRIVVNPGSVGQPRDGDPRAAYAVWDSDTRKMWLRRVSYDVEKTQHVMRRAGLPDLLAARLSLGR